MLSNSIPLNRNEMWYSFEGYDKNNEPIIKKVPHGGVLRGGSNKHYYYSNDREELYNHWVNNFNSRDDYEKLMFEYNNLIETIKSKKVIGLLDYHYPSFFKYHIAFYDAKKMTLKELSDKIVKEIGKIIKHLHSGMVMSEWGNSHWQWVISKFNYNRKTRVLTIDNIPFHLDYGPRKVVKNTYDLNTYDGIRSLGMYMEYDRGYYKDLNELVKIYQKSVDEQTEFINSLKKLL
jgi:hypothetical protein